ncbi:MAG: FAD/FMN-containing dehydrogenase/ferredoxin [Chlamydiales bacterium]
MLQRHLRLSLSSFVNLPTDQRARGARQTVGDLNFFFDEDRPFASRDEPARTTELAISLAEAVEVAGDGSSVEQRSLQQRIITNGFLRSECDHDQNVYLGKLFTRRLTRAVPDVVLQPVSRGEISAALCWARTHAVPVTLRGAASTAMGGAVPGDGGLLLDLSRLAEIEVDVPRRRVSIGSGTRMRPLHKQLAAEDSSLPVYPSNLGGTFAGWLATGGIGLNAFGNGSALDAVRSIDVVLVGGEALRLHADGTTTLLDPDRKLSAAEAQAWFAERHYSPIVVADLATSEGQFAVITALELKLEERPTLHPYLLRFAERSAACAGAEWVRNLEAEACRRPLELKLLSASHLDHIRSNWREEDARDPANQGSDLSNGRQMPWKDIVSPSAVIAPGSGSAPGSDSQETYLFVLLDGETAPAFENALDECPGRPTLDARESVRFAEERFRPQQSKRSGPGLLAAEILLPVGRVEGFLPAAERLAAKTGNELDAEVYYLPDDGALVIAAYLTDHRKASFAIDLLLAPALLDLATSAFEGRAYVLGRWQASHFRRRFDSSTAKHLIGLKRALDPSSTLSPGTFFDLRLRGLAGALLQRLMPLSIRCARLAFDWGSPIVRFARSVTRRVRGAAAERGLSLAEIQTQDQVKPSAHAIGCVNCGECNSVCPIFHESKLRLPQLLTHIGEAAHAGEQPGATAETLLDLCMRCGNCEEVCQSSIPHLPLYAQLESASERQGLDIRKPIDRERQTLVLEHLRSSPSYVRDFLDIRPGGYEKRAPVSLPGSARYVLMRAQADAGPAATCIHCAACVDVCPTGANQEYFGDDARTITTLQERCIGCGTCVEVCPANRGNDGQTLRVMEVPARAWFDAAAEFAEGEAAR